MKFKKLLLLMAAVLTLTACGGKETNDPKETSISDEENKDSLLVDKNLLSIEITLPAYFFENSSQEEVKTSAKDSGIEEVIFNDNGSVTYKMSKSKHKELMDTMKTQVDESIKLILADKETYPSFAEITYNKDFSEFTIKCDSSLYSEMESFSAFAFYMQGMSYQVFNGVETEDINVIVNYIDMETGDALDTFDSSQMEE